MQSYYLDGANVFTFRTKPTGSSDLTLNLENMYTLATSSVAISGYTFNAGQSILQFTASLTASTGDEFRAYISDSSSSHLWDGTIQCYASQSINKAEYKNQSSLSGSYISNNSDNEYIILT